MFCGLSLIEADWKTILYGFTTDKQGAALSRHHLLKKRHEDRTTAAHENILITWFGVEMWMNYASDDSRKLHFTSTLSQEKVKITAKIQTNQPSHFVIHLDQSVI